MDMSNIVSYLMGQKAAFGSVAVGVVDNPVDAKVEDGETASFTVRALGGNLSYQWQYSADGGETWADSAEETATAATLSFTMAEAYDEYKFRCVVSGDGGTATSTAATLYYYVPLAITTQPVDFEGAVGETASFTVEATGTSLTYQWEWYNGTKWENTTVSGNKTDTITMTITEARYAYRYRCKITDKFGDVIVSDVVRILEPEDEGE